MFARVSFPTLSVDRIGDSLQEFSTDITVSIKQKKDIKTKQFFKKVSAELKGKMKKYDYIKGNIHYTNDRPSISDKYFRDASEWKVEIITL